MASTWSCAWCPACALALGKNGFVVSSSRPLAERTYDRTAITCTLAQVRISGDDTEIICPISAEVLNEGEWAARMPCGHYFGKEELFEVSVTASSHPRPLSPPLFRLPADLRVSVCPLHARLCSLVMFRMGGSGYVSTTRVLCAAASFRQTMTRCPACVLSRTPSCMRALSLCVVPVSYTHLTLPTN